MDFKSTFLTNFLALLSGFEIGLTVFFGTTLTGVFGAGLPLPVVIFLGVVGFEAGFSTFLPDDLEALSGWATTFGAGFAFLAGTGFFTVLGDSTSFLGASFG